MSATTLARDLARSRQAAGLPVFDGGLGENPVPAPQCLLNIARKHVGTTTRYGNAAGSPALQQLLHSDRVVVANGLRPLLFAVQLAFHNMYPESDIFHVVPFWVGYREQTDLLNIPAKSIIPSDRIEYKISASDLDTALSGTTNTTNTPNTPHLVIFNHPCNPSGAAYSGRELEALAKVFRKHKSIVFCDEIYSRLAHDDSNIPVLSDFYSRVICASSLSKITGCGGWRFGWATFGPTLTKLHKAVLNTACQVYTSPSPLWGRVAEYVLSEPPEFEAFVEFQRNTFRTVKQRCVEQLKLTKLQATTSKAAWYFLLNFEAYRDHLKRFSIKNATQLAATLATDVGIIMVAGSAFGLCDDDLVLRLSFVAVDVNVEQQTFNAKKLDELLMQLRVWLRVIEH
ncbi:pyridoxal phosphate-dependent aminotransferase [bacterium]|nr:pyridoxal phosphate-dependent aminotransferase [bacterium]